MGSSYFANFFSSHDLGKYKRWVKYPGNITYCRGEYHFRSGIFRMTLNQVYLRKTVSLSVSNHLPIWNIPIKFWIVHNPFFNFLSKLQRSIINLLIFNPNHLCPYLIEIHKCLRTIYLNFDRSVGQKIRQNRKNMASAIQYWCHYKTIF